MMTWSRRKVSEFRQKSARPFCKCFNDGKANKPKGPGGCKCGEHADVNEWHWEVPMHTDYSWVAVTRDHKQVTFHPFYSSGTAVVRGTTPLSHDYHYYWEIKMLTEPYGTDVMVGLGTKKVDILQSRYNFTSILGQDAESYGLSYTGAVRHDDMVIRDGAGFCKGTIIGVKVDLWQGTLEFFLNRKSRGVSFFNLRRHPTQALFPMMCSTAAQSTMRLIYSSSWQASLLVDAAKILGASVSGDLLLPPGLKNELKSKFWMMYPNDSCSLNENDLRVTEEQYMKNKNGGRADGLLIPYGFFVEEEERNFPVAVIYDDVEESNVE